MVDSPLRRTSLYDKHRALSGRLVPFAGWEMPVQYAGVVIEHKAVRQAAGLFDVSHMGELLLEGDRASEVVSRATTADLRKIENGQAVYTVAMRPDAGILDDLIVYKHSPTKLMVVCNASNRDKISAHFAGLAKGVADFRDLSDETALIALQGPKAIAILSRVAGGAAFGALASFRFAQGTLAGIPVTIARTGYTGEDGVEIFAPWASATAIWEALEQAGKDDGILPIGLGARDTLRLEARLSLYGNEIDETTHPLEAGLGWVVKWDNTVFEGRAALEAIRAAGLTRKLVGFEMTGRGIGRHGYPITDEAGTHVGIVTSGSPGPSVDRNIGLGYVPTSMSAIGTTIGIEIRGAIVAAKVVSTPFYKRGH